MPANFMTLAVSGAFDPTDHVVAWRLFEIGGVWITNQMLMTAVATSLLFAALIHAARRIAVRGTGIEAYETRGRFPQVIEVICEFLREQVARPNLGPLTDRYIGYVWSIFFFILFCNLLGLIPVGPMLVYTVGWFVEDQHALEHWGGTATASLALTGAMACVSFFMFHFVGIRHQGWRYFKHFNPGPWYMAPMLVPIEVVGTFIKTFALAMRLFANMVGGHLVIAALILIIFTFGSWFVAGGVLLAMIALMFLEIFVALLQAYIFTMLTVLFIAMGAVHHNEDHGDHETQPHASAAAGS